MLLFLSLVFGQWEVSMLSLWPALMAFLLIFLTRQVVLSLWLAAFGGVLMTCQGQVLSAPGLFLEKLLLPALVSEWNLQVILFTLLMGGFVALVEHGRGLEGVMKSFFQRFQDQRKGVEMSGVGLGFLCFFDGLANAMFVGRVMKPLADRCGISSAKMAYIVDTTSSPLACLAFVSTWIAYQLSMIRQGYEQVGQEVNAYEVFISSIPCNFYCWASLILLLGVLVIRWWPFSERRDQSHAQAMNVSPDSRETETTSYSKRDLWLKVFLPIAVLWLGIVGGLYWSGATIDGSYQMISLADAIGKADTAKVLVLAAFFATCFAWFFNGGLREPLGANQALKQGMLSLWQPIWILIGAWCLSGALKQLGAADVLSHWVGVSMPSWLFPALVFLLGAVIAFVTGTSWGTMGILMPLALPVALGLGAEGNWVAAVVAAVFSGAVFGDHCSPLSDTTIVSAMATGCETLEHVRTQLPFALTAAGFALLLGFLPYGLGLDIWVFWVGVLLFVISVLIKTQSKKKEKRL